jgi:HNH endonuclease
MTPPPYLPPRELRNIKPIGKCIYCERTDNLTREHVVPRGMGGTITLPKGSCKTCAEITKKIETACMRKTLIHVRVKYGLHRHPKERPETVPVTYRDWSDNEVVKQVPVADYPTLWAMPIYEYPGILSIKRPDETRFGILHSHIDDASFQKLLRAPGVKSITVTSGGVDTWNFARWIAKIGYCYAVARLGVEKVKSSPLIDMILNGSHYPNYLIGGLNNLNLPSQEFMLEPKSDEVFKVGMREQGTLDGKSYICVYVRLLPMLEGATYLAVVCENNV